MPTLLGGGWGPLATTSDAGQICSGRRPPDCTQRSGRAADLSSGPDKGDTIEFEVRTDVEVPELQFRYQFYEYQRSTPLLWLLVALCGGRAFGRLQGVRALVGLALSLGVLVLFVVPALLRDSAVLVALVGTVAVAYIAIYLAHGVNISARSPSPAAWLPWRSPACSPWS